MEKYCPEKANSWYVGVLNKPNIPYWNGTMEEFYMLYDYAIDAVEQAPPRARIGGFEIAGVQQDPTWRISFAMSSTKKLRDWEERDDFRLLSFHAKRAPNVINTADGVVTCKMGSLRKPKTLTTRFQSIASYPQIQDKTIIISECGPMVA